MSNPNIYTVGWICAVETELIAAASFLDEEHDDPDCLPINDNNSYILGRIGKHNVVIAALPDGQYGLVTAATVARDMVRSFPNVRIGLMVGIGGGAPSANHDIRLGDIVVSSPGPGSGGVFQYDYGKTIQDSKFVVTSHLNQPPQFILAAIATLKTQYKRRSHNIEQAIEDMLQNNRRLQKDYRKPGPSTDRLYTSTYMHAGTKEQECIAMCDATHLVERPERSDEQDSPTIHYGTVASANQLMKDANLRDKLSAEHDVLCFEMEAAGLMNQFPCIVIRGICDYSDTHKNKVWQGYAAMAAAAYAKDLLCKVAPNKIEAERKLMDVLSEIDSKLESLDSYVQTTHTEIRSIRMDKHSDDIMQWLAPPDVTSNFNKAIKARHPGSGSRLLESKAYTMWKIGNNSFLWLHGIPGCGKTILTSTVIEDLQKSQSHAQTLLYFYFDFTDSRKQSFENTLRSLIGQIYHQNENTPKYLKSLYSLCRNGKVQPSFESLQRAFMKTIGGVEEVRIVLDALDECTPRGELLAWLRSINQDLSQHVNMYVLVTSRPEQDIESAIKRYANNEQIIAIRDDLLEADIRNYVQARVREHEGLSRWRGHKEIQSQIEASLLEKANGM
ncbi:hypothetical protein G7054_g12729 [Neopestalotiopsis clavispora]|nr:hypothetical protein G7054_g12729 [Neopestalotiopsis clavispora]